MASALTDLLGDCLRGPAGEVSTLEALSGKQVVGLYFSAHFGPLCRHFTPKLVEWYTAGLKNRGLEVVLVSSDKEEDKFQEYFGEMPWLAVPFAERDRRQALATRFKVKGIPSLVLLDGQGKLIRRDGKEALAEDPAGADLPWQPQTPAQLLAGARIITKGGGHKSIADVAQGKVAVALYFSAHWCPPCRSFTPQLAEWYSADLQGRGLEVIFVSWDEKEETFKEYFETMPWLALDYADRKLSNKLNSTLSIKGIPSLVVLDPELRLITADGRDAVVADPRGEELPWRPKPVKDLANGPGVIDEVPTVVVFCETQAAAEQKALEEAMAPAAQKYLDEQEAREDGDLQFSFMICRSAGGIGGKLRSMVSLPVLPPRPHEHALVKVDNMGGWGCDGCGIDSSFASERWTCSQGSDFDYCGQCNEKAGNATEQLSPALALVDMPSGRAFYLAPAGAPITAAAMEKFLADYSAGKLDRRQLGI